MCKRAFSGCAEKGWSLVAVHGLLLWQLLLLQEHGHLGEWACEVVAQGLRCPDTRVESMSPAALASGFLTIGPTGKPKLEPLRGSYY